MTQDILTIEAIQTLSNIPQWIGWKNEDGTKVPKSANGKHNAKSNDPSTWSDFATAQAAVDRFSLDGLGFVFTDTAGIVGIDLDKCIDDDGNLTEWATKIVKDIDSYTEISPSGRGLHIFVYGFIPKGVTNEKVEMYLKGRYFTVTGNHYPGTPGTINRNDRAVWALYEAQSKQSYASNGHNQEPPEVTSDHPYVQTAFRSELDRVAGAPQGGRNNALNRAAFNLGQFINAGLLDQSEVERGLAQAAVRSGLEQAETMKTINSGLKAGMATPRESWPEMGQPYQKQSGEANGELKANDPPSEPEARPEQVDTRQENAFYLTQSADDEGNAQCLIARYPDTFLCTDSHGWMVYNGRYWEREGAEALLDRCIVNMLTERRLLAVRNEAEAIVKATKPSSYNLRGCKALLKSLIYSDISEFDNDPDLLNCNNGVVNLKTGEFTHHDPSQRFTYCLATNYNADAEDHPWVEWLYSVLVPEDHLGDDTDNAPYATLFEWLQMAVGYSLTGRTNEEFLFYAYGDTRAGKGTFTETLLKMIGTPLAVETDFDTFTMKRDGDANNFDLAGLKATRFVAASETNKYQALNPRRIKMATGGNGIRCCFKHKDHFTYFPQFKIWLSSNEPVNADADDDAIWGRVKVIHFPNSYLGREDKTLKAKMLKPENLEGVLKWAVNGAIEWYKALPEGLKDPPTVARSTKEHRDALDDVAVFLSERYEDCLPRENDGRPKKDIKPAGLPCAAFPTLYQDYEAWCKTNGVPPKHKRTLSRSLKNKGFILGGNENRENVSVLIDGEWQTQRVQVIRGLKKLN